MERKAGRAAIPAYRWVVCFQVLQKEILFSEFSLDFSEYELDGIEI